MKERTILSLAIFLGIAGLAAIAWGVVTTEPHSEEASVAYATWALALFTLILAIGVPLTIWDSGKKAREQEDDQFYAQLDGMYLEIQKLVIQYPHLGEPAALLKHAKPDQVAQYNAFAFVVWNFIESIDDFTRNDANSRLAATWRCIIDYEGERHARWFADTKNKLKFKDAFRENMKDRIARWTLTLPPTSAS